MKSMVLVIIAVAASLVVLFTSLGSVPWAQLPPGAQFPPGAQLPPGVSIPLGAEWLSLSDRAALVITDLGTRDGSVEGRLMVEVGDEWVFVNLNEFRTLPLH